MIDQPSPSDLSERLAFTPEEITTLLPISKKTVYELLRSGQLGGRKITARRWIISRDNLNAYLTDQGHAGQ